MAIRTIIVNLDIDETNSALLRCAVDLARRLDAKLIGHCAAEPLTAFVAAEGAAIAASVYTDYLADIDTRQKRARRLFDDDVPKELVAGWIAEKWSATYSLIDRAGEADLLMLARPISDAAGRARSANLGDVILGAGRPVLAVPPGAMAVPAETMVIGWKNTRESRRAVCDALPLLRLAKTVIVATVDESDEDGEVPNGVIGFLGRHDIAADHVALPRGNAAAALIEAAQKRSAMLVTGAYGHQRWRQRLLGGVTEQLIGEAGLARLFSS